MAACQTKTVKLQFLDRPEIVTLVIVDSCEELWRLAARKVIGVKPSALEIFGLKSVENSTWFSPSEPVPLNQAWTSLFSGYEGRINYTNAQCGQTRHAQTLDHISKLTVFDSSHLTEFLCMHNRRQQKWHPEVQKWHPEFHNFIF